MSDIDTVVVDSLKALDPEWPIREADMGAWFGIRRMKDYGMLASIRRFAFEVFANQFHSG